MNGEDSQTVLSALYKALEEYIKTTLTTKAFSTYTSALPISFTFDTTLSKIRIDEVLNRIWCTDGKTWSERIWGSVSDLRSELTYALLTEQNTDYIKKRFNVEYSKAKRILTTEYSYIANAAAVQRYADSGIQEYEIITKPGDDGRICDECKALNHKRFKVGEINPLPLHPNCRCAIVPVIKKN